jgi:hypothetical protein
MSEIIVVKSTAKHHAFGYAQLATLRERQRHHATINSQNPAAPASMSAQADNTAYSSASLTAIFRSSILGTHLVHDAFDLKPPTFPREAILF